jgi:hypothetical protein
MERDEIKSDYSSEKINVSSIEDVFEARVLEEQGRSIRYRTCSWQKASSELRQT